MAASHISRIQGGRKPCFPGWEKLNYSIKTQLGLNDHSWILSQNGSRLNCPRIFRKLNTSPYAYSSTLTTLEIFIVIESSNVSSLFRNQCFKRQSSFLRTDAVSSGSLRYATGSRASPHVPRLKVHVLKVSVQENNFAQLWLQVKMRSHRAHCSADLLFKNP